MILVDLNVILDVLQKREPHYRASAAVLDLILKRDVTAALAGHSVTTIHYLVAKYQKRETADQVINWLLQHFSVATVNWDVLQQATTYGWPDFEVAVVASAAGAASCEAIVTRNIKDFRDSKVVVLTPDEYLMTREAH